MNENISKFAASVTRRAALRTLGLVSVAATSGLTIRSFGEGAKRKVVVWSEGTANVDPASKEVYPHDINTAIAEGLEPMKAAGWDVVKATLSDPDQGLSEDTLNHTDVLIWWGHKKHGEVKDELVERINTRVREQGMGFIGTHSAHFSKPYKKLMGTACSWREYVEDGTSAEILVKLPDHPICKGVKNFRLPAIERYGEPFKVPTPEAVPLEGIYTKPNGDHENARMGLCWTVGKGRVFYFVPGHETHNDYYRPEIRQIMANAVEWAAPRVV